MLAELQKQSDILEKKLLFWGMTKHMASGAYSTPDRSLIRPMASTERQTANKTYCEFRIIK